jgi:hypothetical protein
MEFGLSKHLENVGLGIWKVAAGQFLFEFWNVSADATSGMTEPQARGWAHHKTIFLPVVDWARAAPFRPRLF